jgi:arylsulfatase
VDADVGQMPDAAEKAGERENTIVIFTSDNGLEFIRPWNGWADPWRGGGHCFIALEGGIPVPFVILGPPRISRGETPENAEGTRGLKPLAPNGEP